MSTSFLPRRPSPPVQAETEAHLFTVGQAVRLKGGLLGSAKPSGVYQITGVVPPSGKYPQYRIRSDDERHERMVTEDNLELVNASGVNPALQEKTSNQGSPKEPIVVRHP